MTKFEINSISWTRFLTLRKRLFKAIKESLEVDGHYKSYEGRFDITFSLPNYFEELEDNPKAEWCVHLACYVIGPTRGRDWVGETFDEALGAMEKDINEWLEDHEEWMATKDADEEMEI